MEIAIPGIALGLLYIVNNQNKSEESFENKKKDVNILPNTNIPNRNFPTEYPIVSGDTDQTSRLSAVNKFNNVGGVYTDKYFDPEGIKDTIAKTNSNQPQGELYHSLTGKKVDTSYFQHNNMVPFFGSNIRTSAQNANTHESILDNYVGSGSQTIIKKEVAPMFAPSENQQWAFGAPNSSDFYQSRVNPSMRMANVKPFEEEMVAPGLGGGFSKDGIGGFNSGMMMRESWLDRGVDELRVANKPKPGGFTLFGHEGPANSHIKNISDTSNIGRMEKNRPERMFETGVGTENNFLLTTVGAGKGETLRAINPTMYRDTARQTTTTDYAGGAGYHNSSEYITGEYMPSTNIELGSVPLAPANAQGRNYANDGDFEIKAKKAYPNNRTMNKQGDYFGSVGGGLHAAVAPLLDILRPSRKENVIGTLRPYQNPGTTVPQSYIFNPADKAPVTIRETTENSKMHMNVNRNQRGGAYEVTEHQAIENSRQTTGDFYYAGVAGAGDRTRQPKSYEAEYNQRNNDVKSSTLAGYTPAAGNMNIMTNDINMRQVNRDEYLENTRAIAPTMPYQTRDIHTMGAVQGSRELYSGINNDRNSGDIYDQLKGNPYVVNYKKGL